MDLDTGTEAGRISDEFTSSPNHRVAGVEVKWHDLQVQPADLFEQDSGGEPVLKSSTELS